MQSAVMLRKSPYLHLESSSQTPPVFNKPNQVLINLFSSTPQFLVFTPINPLDLIPDSTHTGRQNLQETIGGEYCIVRAGFIRVDVDKGIEQCDEYFRGWGGWRWRGKGVE
jgi:hypothetical protein